MEPLNVKVFYKGASYKGDVYLYAVQIDGKRATEFKACGRDIQIFLNGVADAQFALTGTFSLNVEYDHSAAFLMSASKAAA